MTYAGAPQYFSIAWTTSSRVAVLLFKPKTAQELDEADCLVNSISIGPRSDNWHNISDFAVFGLKSKTATREEDFELLRRTKGRREVTEADEKAVKELCQPYLDWRKEALT